MLQSQHARRSFVEGKVLQLGGVGGVVRGDSVDVTASEARPKRLDVLRRTKWWMNLEDRIEVRQGALIQREVMRGHFAT